MIENINKKRLIIILLSVLIVISVIGITPIILYENFLNSGASGKNAEVEYRIEKGYSVNKIIQDLYSKGLIKNKYFARYYIKDKNIDKNLKVGIYKFNMNMTPVKIFDIIKNGQIDTDYVNVTIPEGFTVKQIAERLYKGGIIKSEDEFIREAQNGSFEYDYIKQIPAARPSRLEGYLFPATYELKKGMQVHNIIEMMLKKFNQVYTQNISPDLKQGQNIDDIMKMASIVEGEAKLDSERSIVAAVFYNRLKINMPLQSCATIEYVLGKRKDVLRNSDLEINSPYNTYKNAGLPIGPICNPGEKSISAAMNPSNVDYLYFVVKGDGGHYFTKNYNDFLNFQAKNKSK